MITETLTVTVLIAADGMWLTDGSCIPCKRVSVDDTAEAAKYYEIGEVERNAMMERIRLERYRSAEAANSTS